MVRGLRMWLGQRKLAIFAAISECILYAEAKYCAFEIHGEPKYYVCPRTEYCCNFGCCVSPGFQIYHLWYYWLLVIIMFLVCSGGGWWYRYWLQGRYRPSTSSVPPRMPNSRAQSTFRGPTCRAQQARVTYNPARNTVLLHRMWKGPQRSATPPAYNNGGAASSAQFQDTNVVLNENNCPYYELYGPPPSYETVIAQTRGKITSPTAIEHIRNNAQAQQNVQSQNVAHCFSHNYSSVPTSERRSSCGSNSEEPENYHINFGCKNFVQKWGAAQPTMRVGINAGSEGATSETRAQNVSRKLLPLCVTEMELNGERVRLQNSESSPDMLAVGARSGTNVLSEYNQPAACVSSQLTQNSVGPDPSSFRSMRSFEGLREGKNVISKSDSRVGIRGSDQSGSETYTRLEPKVSRVPKMFTYAKSDAFGVNYRRAQSGSLRERAGGNGLRGESRNRYCDVHRQNESVEKEERTNESGSRNVEFEMAEAKALANGLPSEAIGSNCEECMAQNGRSNSELNPSNIVILPSPTNANVQINSLPATINIIENYQHYPPTSSPAQLRSNTLSTNFESENKLGRSKSLD